MILLAQMFADAPVPMLPDAGVFERYVLESPWAAMGVLIGGAVIAFFVLNRMGKARHGAIVAAGLVALSAIVFGIGSLVTTEREALQQRTIELVGLAARAQTGELKEFLDPRVTLSAMGGVPTFADRDSLLEQVRQYVGGTFKIREHSTGRVGATIDGENVARSQLRVWVRLDKDQSLYDAPLGSWWRIDWRRDPVVAETRGRSAAGSTPAYGPWRASRITLMQLDGVGVHPEFAK